MSNVVNGVPVVRFAGNQWLTTPSVFPTSADYTITAMFSNPSSASTTSGMNILSSTTFPTNSHAFAVVYQQSGVTGLAVFQSAGYFPAGNLAMPFNSDVVIVTVVYTNATNTIQYYMGGYDAGATTNTQPRVTDSTIEIGAFNAPSFSFNFIGDMLDVILWDSALNASTVASNELQLAALVNIPYPQHCTFFSCR